MGKVDPRFSEIDSEYWKLTINSLWHILKEHNDKIKDLKTKISIIKSNLANDIIWVLKKTPKLTQEQRKQELIQKAEDKIKNIQIEITEIQGELKLLKEYIQLRKK